jgi:hypothetical protein
VAGNAGGRGVELAAVVRIAAVDRLGSSGAFEVGDEVFFDILRTYYDRFKGSNVRTSDFIAVAEEVSGQDLDVFFDNWLYSEEIAPMPALGLKAE